MKVFDWFMYFVFRMVESIEDGMDLDMDDTTYLIRYTDSTLDTYECSLSEANWLRRHEAVDEVTCVGGPIHVLGADITLSHRGLEKAR